MGTVVAIVIAAVLLYLKFRPRVGAIMKGMQQAP